jgi:cysteine desulfurase/selenocysteine lyase
VSFDIEKVRHDFPLLQRKIYDKPIVYLDNAATTQKPLAVIDALSNYYKTINSNIHRGVHFLSEMATLSYEDARTTVKQFINAGSKNEIIFTAGATASINLVAYSFGERYISAGDEIIISGMEHHANIVPWQLMAERKKAVIKIIPVDDDGKLIIDELPDLISDRTKIIALTYISNSLGVINPVKSIINEAHSHNIPVLIDGAQSVQHGNTDVQDLDCDFFAFSGHKIYGPTGIGVLYGKEKLLEELPPYQGGGDMIENVTFERTTYNALPFKFEAGTMNIADAIGLSAALNYMRSTGFNNIISYESELLNYVNDKLNNIEGIKIYGNIPEKIPVFSITLDNIHPYDAGMVLDKMGIAVRTGTHCTQPLMDRFGIPGTVRASFCFYNTFGEADALCDGIIKIKKMFH